jgi:hypothetical protein
MTDLAAAGNETTTKLISWIGKVLSDHPGQRRQIAADPTLVPQAVEEVLRYEAPSPSNARYVADSKLASPSTRSFDDSPTGLSTSTTPCARAHRLFAAGTNSQ